MMTQATALAHSNLAFVKYWGKYDATLNIPLNNSISMNLSAARTTTTVRFDSGFSEDKVLLEGQEADPKFTARVSRHLDIIRLMAGTTEHALVKTRNTFPAGTGFASSASGFAALSLAAASALGLELPEWQLSILARRGSGSACRSIPGGFVEWEADTESNRSYARQIAPETHWDIVDVAVLVTSKEKAVSSTEGHELALNSPFWQARMVRLPERLNIVRRAILERDFATFGREIEAEALSMHAIMLTSAYEDENAWHPGIFYWTPDTLRLLLAVQEWRKQGMEVYFTLDAGPTVHLMCPAALETTVVDAVYAVGQPDWTMITSRPAPGAYLINEEVG